ncbi:MAG: UDP-N-acetylglucosamine 1-carboxyvinyltransferase [Ruminococcaceae bacterium]|nr:UDP-N-acetylglucosamine 1-carboxyvinyltransferase [Oscillospiraceae bacterium]
MNRIVVTGGKRLVGEVRIGGSKNAALPLLFAGILTGDSCVFENLPRVSDVLQTLEILRFLGARIRFQRSGDVEVDYRDVRPEVPPGTLTSAIRGSVYLLGAMLGRFGIASLPGAGGCDFGSRPIDLHLWGLERLGAVEEQDAEALTLRAESGLSGCALPLPLPSVGATGNLLMAATAARGETVLSGIAIEPHVQALAEFLRAAGADISPFEGGAVRVRGGAPLHGCRVRVIPDMIEAGTYLCAAMATGGRITLREAVPEHLGALLWVLERMGARLQLRRDGISLDAPERYRCMRIETGPYPAFPTDLHPQMAALFCIGGRAVGEGRVRERVWQSRFRYTEELRRMGAVVRIAEDEARFLPSTLHGTEVRSPDLRGGAALLLAALAAEGRTEISNAATVGRGYEHLEAKLRGLGARVRVYG